MGIQIPAAAEPPLPLATPPYDVKQRTGYTGNDFRLPPPSTAVPRKVGKLPKLPAEVLIYVLSLLECRSDVRNSSEVCVEWHSCAAPLLWRMPLFNSMVSFRNFMDSLSFVRDWVTGGDMGKGSRGKQGKWEEELVRTSEKGHWVGFRVAKGEMGIRVPQWQARPVKPVIRALEPRKAAKGEVLTMAAPKADVVVWPKKEDAMGRRRLGWIGSVVLIMDLSDKDGFHPRKKACSHPIHTRRLSLRDHILDGHVQLLATACPNLVRVNLSHCKNLTDAAVIALSKSCSAIKSLNVSRTGITEQSVISVAKGAFASMLRSFYLGGCPQVSEGSLQLLVRYCPALERLDISGLPSVSDVILKDLAMYSLNITWLNLAGNHKLGEHAISTLIAAAPKLETLDLTLIPSLHISGILYSTDKGAEQRCIYGRGAGRTIWIRWDVQA
ncbi:F-box and leucine-rich repeat protein 4 [Borealophlyctis nickersoniae]|nr:F-box and leucine-rich repeat protein 4 [Borealophlyctis nickersoniae]